MIEAALERFMADLAGADDVATFARRWEPSPAPFASVEVRSWIEHAAGGAELVFAEDAQPSLAQLEGAFGPFSEPPRLPSGTRRLRGEWWREGMPVRIVLVVSSPPARDEPLERLVLQRGISRPDSPSGPAVSR